MESRKKNTIKNFIISITSYFLNIILSFVVRTVFIKCLSTEYLGVNGLFINILSILSLVELGAGGAFVSLLYKPLYENDEKKLATIMKTFKKVYFIMALFIGIIGVFLTPFLDYIIAENTIENLSVIYIMYIINSVVGYICASEKALVKADQKSYIVTTIIQIAAIAQYVGQIVVLLLTKNYVLFLAIQIVCTILGNIYVSFWARKKYIFLSQKAEKMDRDTKNEVMKKIRGGFCLHLGYVIASGTDSIVISYFLGLTILGIYSNYLLVIGILEKFVLMIFESVRASASNFAVSNNYEENYNLFKKMEFLIIILMGFITTCLIVLFNPFIRVWLSNEYLLEMPLVILATIINFIGWHGIKLPMSIFRDALGLYYNDRYMYLLESVLNVVISLVLVKFIGLAGIFLGTILSSLCTLISGSCIVFKHAFNKSPWYYWRSLITYLFILIPVGAITYYLISLLKINSWISLILAAFTCAAIVILLYVIVFHKKDEFKYYLNFVKLIMQRKTK